MVSTYIDYNLITRDMRTSLNRVSLQPLVAREAEYYKANIGKVASVDEFLDDYRLYSYAMKAHGLEDMTYAVAFMRKVLESDLKDDNSFANRLTDERYRNFAEAFSFGASTAVAQTDAQTDALIGLYSETIANQSDVVNAETNYYNAVIDTVADVDQFLGNERLRTYAMKAFGLDPRYTSYSHLRQILTSDVSDPNSYVNKLGSSNALNLANAFNFATDGSLPTGTLPQDSAQKSAINESYTLNGSDHVTSAAALLNKAYYEAKIGSITTITQLKADTRLFNYVVTAFGLPASTLTTTFENILTSDLNDPNSYANTMGGEYNAEYKAMAAAFNFQTDGTLASGDSAQTAAQITTTSDGYMIHYNDKDDAADEALIARFKMLINTLTSVDDLLSDSSMMNLTLRAFGLEDEDDSVRKLRRVLTSDLSDPDSYANSLRDERYVKLAKAFNFQPDGTLGAPKLAQSEAEILNTSKSYVIEKSRFGTEEDKTKAQEEAKYYSAEIEKIETLDDFLGNRRLVDFVLLAAGIDPETVETSYIEEMFISDLDDPESFINTESDTRYREIVASFNFDTEGKLLRGTAGEIQTRRGIISTMDLYLNQTLEENAGEDNAGVRLALYFKRMASDVNTAYDLLADNALMQVVRTAFSIPQEMASSDIDVQAEYIKRVLDIEDLHDPEKLEKLLQRFTALYDVENNTDVSPAATILSGGSGFGISADTLMQLTQLRLGG
ncbi:DUF1217 domain-containing protein [Sinorhizobium numidicum]|uniref:DUF1217 domain-containing protein n=1 Tax=Sinorhizobium numidicum TaxID=680248 RepID=A0ABY8D2L5_9HYPH|nr:DUF1217 domain-containing protein [Sinorhizobium numidicum]WEX79114.1 DUF1217 domain-containing protein [Sinorhizobium numidicum]WEX85140.1 DUF1217 domain-containing protein [Sinorhizobium numidicum]